MSLVRNTLVTGVLGSAATAAAAALLAKTEGEPPASPINAISHIAFGDEAARVDGVEAKYFATGLILNTAAIVGWALLQELALSRVAKRQPEPAKALIAGAATSAVAYVTDYHVVPKRLTPGFEKRLSGRSLGVIYGVLAATLAAGALLRKS